MLKVSLGTVIFGLFVMLLYPSVLFAENGEGETEYYLRPPVLIIEKAKVYSEPSYSSEHIGILEPGLIALTGLPIIEIYEVTGGPKGRLEG